MSSERSAPPIAVEGANCWRRAPARRVGFLVDGQSYFAILRDALEGAQRQVLIVGWDFHRQFKLTPDAEGERGQEELAPLLQGLIDRKPELEVRILDWDYVMTYVVEREALPSLQPEWRRDPRLRRHLDAEHPMGASHHQKIVVIDDRLAFTGGLDLTIRRWDTREHRADDPRRLDPASKPYAPFHDVQVMVDGPAAQTLGDVARERWKHATGEELPVPSVARAGPDPWPELARVDLRDVRIGVARTRPAWDGRPAVREIERLFLDALARAKKNIYIEAHIFTSDAIVDMLSGRLQERDGPEVVVVGSCQQPGLVDAALCTVRERLLKRLRDADLHDRLRVVYPAVARSVESESPPVNGGGEACDPRRTGVQIHSKVLVVDDQHLHIGSANLTNRSLGLDTECDLAFDAEGHLRVSRAITALRDDLLAEHLGVEPTRVTQVMREDDSLIAVLDRLGGGPRTLLPIEDEVEPWLQELMPANHLIDPTGPYDADELVDQLVSPGAAGDPPGVRRPMLRAVLVLGGLLAVGLAWKFTPLGDLLEPRRIVEWAEPLRGSWWGVPAATAAFVVASLVLVPVTGMTVAMAILFGPWLGWLGSLAGCLASSAVGFLLGRRALQDTTSRLLKGPRLERLSEKLSEHGLLTVATVRLVPIAPFTVVNVVAGSSSVRMRDFMLGTLISMAPGLLAMSLVADRVAAAVSDPSPWSIAVAVALIGALVLVGRWGKDKLTRVEPVDANPRRAKREAMTGRASTTDRAQARAGKP